MYSTTCTVPFGTGICALIRGTLGLWRYTGNTANLTTIAFHRNLLLHLIATLVLKLKLGFTHVCRKRQDCHSS